MLSTGAHTSRGRDAKENSSEDADAFSLHQKVRGAGDREIYRDSEEGTTPTAAPSCRTRKGLVQEEASG